MQSIHEQIQELQAIVTRQQSSIRRQRGAVVVLVGILAGAALVGAARPSGDATFDTITCRGLKLLDRDGKERFAFRTLPDGSAETTWSDKDGRTRIQTGTSDRGVAYNKLNDSHEKLRWSSTVFTNGTSGTTIMDAEGQVRYFTQFRDNVGFCTVIADASGKPKVRTQVFNQGGVDNDVK